MKKTDNQMMMTAVSLVVLAVLSRLVPHYPNFTAVGALAIFSGSALKDKRVAYALPLIAMFITDLILGFHNTMLVVYASMLVGVALGHSLLNKTSVLRVGGVALLNAVQFFVITNFGIWALGSYYTKDVAGLLTCYTAAIPFFGYSLGGDLFFATLMFGAYSLVAARITRTQTAQ